VTAGQAIPLKWRITDANDVPVLNLTSVTVTVVTIPCSLGTTPNQPTEQSTSGLLNQGNGYYQFNWATPKSYRSSCKQMRLNLSEGNAINPVYHTANFRFVR
jgi:hypothetical protein